MISIADNVLKKFNAMLSESNKYELLKQRINSQPTYYLEIIINKYLFFINAALALGVSSFSSAISSKNTKIMLFMVISSLLLIISYLFGMKIYKKNMSELSMYNNEIDNEIEHARKQIQIEYKNNYNKICERYKGKDAKSQKTKSEKINETKAVYKLKSKEIDKNKIVIKITVIRNLIDRMVQNEKYCFVIIVLFILGILGIIAGLYMQNTELLFENSARNSYVIVVKDSDFYQVLKIIQSIIAQSPLQLLRLYIGIHIII